MRPKKLAAYATAIVLAHLVVTIVHGNAHAKLGVNLGVAGMAFVWAAVIVGPLVAMALLWTRWQKPGLVLLSLTMAGSLLFGVINHFLVSGNDHVGHQGPGAAATLFAVSAVGLAVTEALGTLCGVYYLMKRINAQEGSKDLA
ncbi:MAG: hypothetical protein ACE145_09040 [Terriglobia bacterium]